MSADSKEPRVRFARNCFQADALIVAKCPCCGDVNFLILDEKDRIRTVLGMTVEEIREVLADAESGKLPSFNLETAGFAPGPVLN